MGQRPLWPMELIWVGALTGLKGVRTSGTDLSTNLSLSGQTDSAQWVHRILMLTDQTR